MRNSIWAAGVAAALSIAWADSAGAKQEPDADDPLARASALANRGIAQFDSGNFRESQDSLRQALAIRERLLAADNIEIAATLNDLGASLFNLARFQEAEPLLQRAIAIFRGCVPCRTDLAGALANLASLYREQRRFQEAGKIFTELFDRMLDPAAVKESTAATIYNDYGMMLRAQGDLNGAEAAFSRAAEMCDRSHDPRATLVWASLGDLYYESGNLQQAEVYFRKSVNTCDPAGKDERRCGSPLNGLGLTLMHHGLYDEARALLERALRVFERTYGADSPKVAAVLNNLGNIAEHKHDYKHAEANLSRALTIWTAAFGPGHPDVASANSNLATLYMHRRRWEKSESLYRRALAIDENGKDRRRVARDLNNLGVLYSGMKRRAEAETCLSRAVQEYEQASGPDSPDVASVLLSLASHYAKAKQNAEAIALYKRALEIYERHSAGDAVAAAAFEEYALLARRNDDYADAAKAQAFAMRIRVRSAIAREHLR
jgi:tetratricopeptide (TPR) repeat protein